jgi:hypothetical protein
MSVPRSQTAVEQGLHVCPECSSRLVQPTAWEQTRQEGSWRIWRRCPDCHWEDEGVHGETEIDRFDEELDFGTRELAGELKTLELANMKHAVETLIAALDADLIGPEDFRVLA